MSHYLSFETAKHLHELGVTFPDAHMHYALEVVHGGEMLLDPVGLQGFVNACIEDNVDYCTIPAPCFDEVWAKLPMVIDVGGKNYFLRCRKINETHTALAYKADDNDYLINPSATASKSPTEAAGVLVGVLRKKNLI